MNIEEIAPDISESLKNHRFHPKLPSHKLPTPRGSFSENGAEIIWKGHRESYLSKEEAQERYSRGKIFYEWIFGELDGTPVSTVIRRLNDIMGFNDYTSEAGYSWINNRSQGLYNIWKCFSEIGSVLSFHDSWDISFYGGSKLALSEEDWNTYWLLSQRELDAGSYKASRDQTKIEIEGYRKYARRKICKSEEIISDDDLRNFHLNFTWDGTLFSQSPKRRELKDQYSLSWLCDELKEEHYNAREKSWSDFNIDKVFNDAQDSMPDNSIIPAYVWNLASSLTDIDEKIDPFDKIYRICMSYTNQINRLSVSQKLFENIQKWEQGNFLYKGISKREPQVRLWINWHKMTRDFLLVDHDFGNEQKRRIEWLKSDVFAHIKDSLEYYKKLGSGSRYYISNKLIQKYENLE